ncbi:unnamed protein product [Camellia sinensis]
MSDYLPNKVLIEILSRLPVISLLRFRCVCKSWRSLISTPSFITSHLNHSTTTFNLILLRHYSHRKERFSLHFNNHTFPKFLDLKCPSWTRFKYYFRIVGSCNGLLCLTDDCFGYTNTIILWNPSIHRSLTLPVPRVASKSTSPFMCVHGFGLDLIKNDFKVVRISYLGSENGFKVPPQVEIYVLGNRSWRDFDGVVPRFGMVNYFWSQAYLNGKVHWVSYKLIDPVTRGCFVLFFDLGNEVFGEIELPLSLVHQFPRNMLTAIVGESLSVLQYDSPIYSKSCTVWVMKEYGVVGSWSKQYTIDLDERLVLMLGLRKNGEMLLGMGRQLVSYDFESQEITNLGVRGSKDAFWVDNYTESLVLLEEGTQVVDGRSTNSSDAVNSEGEPALPEEDDGPEESLVEQRAYFMQTVMLNTFEACL